MSGTTTSDSGDALPMDGTDHLEAGISVSTPVTESEEGKPKKPRKPRTKRPRPTFDDGALTRAFKFPSKTYPRSSYYVTSDEIIIRIKKAKKKWKLVVPKKRVVAYRTNRWFAKPRWIELELTFTQASKLGLVVARKKPLEAAAETQAITDPSPEIAIRPQPDAESDFNPEGMAAWQETFEPDIELDQPDGFEEIDGASDAVAMDALDAGDIALDNPPVEIQAEPILEPLAHPEPTVAVFAEPALPPPSVPLVANVASAASIHPQVARPLRRSNGYRLAASLAFLLLGIPTAWLAFGNFPEASRAAQVACTPAECTRQIVTGSINRPDTARLTVAPEATPSVAPVAMAKRPEPNVPVLPEPTTNLVEQDARPAATEPPPVVAALIAPEPETASTPPANAAPPPPLASTVDNPACRELNTFSQTINIQFDYTKANLDRSVFRALDAFADRLRECPTFKVTIEGHTDSDGQADRNEALSLRRAKAVLEYLVDVGANANQLTAIGLGQSRPLAPNVTPENKRSNRRAVLVVEVPGQNN